MYTLMGANSIERFSSWHVVKEVIIRQEPQLDWNSFLNGLDVWLQRPHVLNRRLCAVKSMHKWFATNDHHKGDRWQQLVSHLIRSRSVHGNPLNVFDDASHGLVRQHEGGGGSQLSVEIRELLPKQCMKRCSQQIGKLMEFVVIDYIGFVAAFVPWHLDWSHRHDGFVTANHTYAFRYATKDNDTCIQLVVLSEDVDLAGVVGSSPDVVWLADKVLPKICQWAKEAQCPSRAKRPLQSLSLIPAADYISTYHKLKATYGPGFVEKWPEKTDPSKFVYEDIAIASYLLVLWAAEIEQGLQTEKQSFVDLGCGNGLLTYILSSEGHRGIGVDLQRRNIWNLLKPTAHLIEVPITPSSESLFPDYDWIIGNHSDELTPWIPVIAARSSYRMRFFLLPCCAHNFTSKFQRRNSRLSQYEDYLNYVEEIGVVCGFSVERDKLRIPSTKRICLIGKCRSYVPVEWPIVDERIASLIETQSRRGDPVDVAKRKDELWAAEFKSRERVQPPRNCTALDPSVKEHVVRVAFDAILVADSDATLGTVRGRWRLGGSVHLSALAHIVESSVLQKMKNEFGGLQTLLRNHNHIFQVVKGTVSLRNYLSVDANRRVRKKKKHEKVKIASEKKKPCWFHSNHPDGCPLSDDKCSFLHV